MLVTWSMARKLTGQIETQAPQTWQRSRLASMPSATIFRAPIFMTFLHIMAQRPQRMQSCRSLDGHILLQGLGTGDDGRPESLVEIGGPVDADRRKLLRAGVKQAPQPVHLSCQDGGDLALLPADRPVQAGPEADAALAALLRHRRKRSRHGPTAAAGEPGPRMIRFSRTALRGFSSSDFSCGKIRDLGHRAGHFAERRSRYTWRCRHSGPGG